MDPKTRYVDTSAGSIAYQVFGDGNHDVLFLPGVVSHLDLMWSQASQAHLLRRLGSFARVVTFDRLGVGLSDPLLTAPTLEERAAEIGAVLDAAEVGPVSVIGFSETGAVAAYYGASNPGRIRSIVFASAFVKGSSPDCDWGLRSEALDAMGEVVEHWGEGRSLEVMAPSVAGSAPMRRLFGTFERSAVSRATARAMLDVVRHIDVTDVLDCIDVPALVITRRDDPFVPVAQAEEIARRVRGAELVIVDGEDHLPWVGDCDSYLDPVERFLTGEIHSRDADRALATVLFTDIVGSTDRLATMGDRAWAALVARHDELVRNRLEEDGGREVKTLGDGFLAVFDGPLAAVRCATRLAADVRELGLEIRAGVHTGEVQLVGTDVSGITVNMAARVAALAGPGEVLTTTAVTELLAPAGIRFEMQGSHDLKGIGVQVLHRAGDARPTAVVQEPRPTTLADRITLRMARIAPGLARAVSAQAERRASRRVAAA